MAKQHSTTTESKQDKTITEAISLLYAQLKQPKTESLNNPSKVKQYLTLALSKEEREVFMVLFLDARNRLIESDIMFNGTLTQTAVYPREVVKQALVHNAASVIFAHNHPSGDALPSNADKALTEQLQNALGLLDVRVLDHFIVAGNEIYSFAEHGVLDSSHASVKDDNKDYEKRHYAKPFSEISGFNDFGTGIGNYIKAISKNDKDMISSRGENVAETAFSLLATLGKLIVYADMKELQGETGNIGWLVTTLAELGSNAHCHSTEATFIQSKIKELHQS
ncbi:RadC family protein [Methylotenera sp. L2L1]|uniref:RadC family protein n=1 Tax=Methylotenera sp. L2L1 TaxID=1502770 RepID=UPI00068E85B2